MAPPELSLEPGWLAVSRRVCRRRSLPSVSCSSELFVLEQDLCG